MRRGRRGFLLARGGGHASPPAEAAVFDGGNSAFRACRRVHPAPPLGALPPRNTPRPSVCADQGNYYIVREQAPVCQERCLTCRKLQVHTTDGALASRYSI